LTQTPIILIGVFLCLCHCKYSINDLSGQKLASFL